MKDIKNSIDDIEVNLRDLPELTDRLADVREETLRYSQLATAQENLKHLFTVPETVVKTETQIVDGNLLDAHKALSELEQARDDLVCKQVYQKRNNPKTKYDFSKNYFKLFNHCDKMAKRRRTLGQKLRRRKKRFAHLN